MALNIDSIEYYNKNVVRAVKNWNILSNATISGESIVINPGGTAGYDLSNSYNNGLKACLFRSLDVTISTEINQQFNYENYIEIVLKGEYRDNSDNIIKMYKTIGLTYIDSIVYGSDISIKRLLKMQNFNLDECTIYVINHTKADIILKECTMKRSQDINGSQIGESIGWGISLHKVIGYLDGCKVFYDNEERPTKMWWMEDEQGQFSGINVDNERMIKFERKNEILLD